MPAKQKPPSNPTTLNRKWIDRLWLLLLLAFLVTALIYLRSGLSCAYLGTDFRGYYASAQIALKHGFSKVYDQELQNAAQETLPLHCPDGSLNPPLLHVSMPYLPVFVLLFLPLTLFEYTTSYLLFSILNLILLTAYLLRFSRGLGARPGIFGLLEWMICLPILSNLALGQMNMFLVICFGEFILSYLRGEQVRSGWWLAGMLIKPQSLILLLPGLAAGRRWRVLLGFATGWLIVLGSSFLLAGVEGVTAAVNLALRFAGPLIQTGATMMNWRALALNMKAFLPGWSAWGIATIGMLIMAVITLREWLHRNLETESHFLLLILATLTATFTISWHSHFYMMMLLIPILLVLDYQNKIPSSILAAWVFGLPGLYLLTFLVQQNLARNMLGLGTLGFNLILFIWANQRQSSEAISMAKS